MSEIQVKDIVNSAYNEAIKNGIVNGQYTTVINGKTVTVVLNNGNSKTPFGANGLWDIFNKGGQNNGN